MNNIHHFHSVLFPPSELFNKSLLSQWCGPGLKGLIWSQGEKKEGMLEPIKGNIGSHTLTFSAPTCNAWSTGSTEIPSIWLQLLDHVCLIIMYSSLIYSGFMQSVSFVTVPAWTAAEPKLNGKRPNSPIPTVHSLHLLSSRVIPTFPLFFYHITSAP